MGDLGDLGAPPFLAPSCVAVMQEDKATHPAAAKDPIPDLVLQGGPAGSGGELRSLGAPTFPGSRAGVVVLRGRGGAGWLVLNSTRHNRHEGGTSRRA